MTDRGRAAVAAAEEIAFGGTTLDETLDRRRAEQILASVVEGPWWRSCATSGSGRCPGITVRLVAPRADALSSSARDRGDAVELRFADGQLTAGTVAHELAHALAGVARGHDATFRAAYVDVVAVLDGAAGAAALRVAFERVDIAAGERRWPPPYRALGDGFVLGAG
jgi:hypothetical protein